VEANVSVVGGQGERQGAPDLVALAELISQTPGAHPIASADELRSDAFDSDEELHAFLAFVTESRNAPVA
jgi:2-polyprenyl-6-methoxyphenol hydroxylase-like FAD-dependent oxidoreductase